MPDVFTISGMIDARMPDPPLDLTNMVTQASEVETRDELLHRMQVCIRNYGLTEECEIFGDLGSLSHEELVRVDWELEIMISRIPCDGSPDANEDEIADFPVGMGDQFWAESYVDLNPEGSTVEEEEEGFEVNEEDFAEAQALEEEGGDEIPPGPREQRFREWLEDNDYSAEQQDSPASGPRTYNRWAKRHRASDRGRNNVQARWSTPRPSRREDGDSTALSILLFGLHVESLARSCRFNCIDIPSQRSCIGDYARFRRSLWNTEKSD
jgi:hypothetical protein